MPVNPADSPILGTLYGSDAMRAVFDERAYFQRMLDVEAALARVQARFGNQTWRTARTSRELRDGNSWSRLRCRKSTVATRYGRSRVGHPPRKLVGDQPSWRRELVFGVRRRPGDCWLASSARTSCIAAART